jgi:DNA-binding HxlR family transcriptional regulator
MKIITDKNDLPNLTLDEISRRSFAIGGDALTSLILSELNCREEKIDELESALSKISDLALEIEAKQEG